MLHIPKKRSCPSCNRNTWANMRRQPAGDSMGKIPSMTRTRARASQKVSPSKVYFLPGGGVAVALPRKTLKNSEDDGSTTITSVFLPKLAL